MGQVKNQYFGDNRDLFKYDLALTLVQAVPSLQRFTFIPMLTHQDGSGQGDVIERHKKAPGYKNKKLRDFLDECVVTNQRDVKEIKQYFNENRVPIKLYGDDYYLERSCRQAYFKNLSSVELDDTLIFLDPDNGFQIKDSSEKHLLFTELHDLYECMGSGSVLMVFQYRPPFTSWDKLVMEKMVQLDEHDLKPSMAVAAGDVSFFLFAKDLDVLDEIAGCIERYRKTYPKLRIWNT